MPGRQSTGPAVQKQRKPKKQTKKRSLNALAIAEHQIPQNSKIRQHRLGEVESGRPKRKRNASDDDEAEDEEATSQSKRPRAGDKDRFGNEIEGGSDSEGNEWVTGQVDSNDDSELDSDEAMGESDEERFEGYTFRGSSSTKVGKKRKAPVVGPTRDSEHLEVDLNEDDGPNSDSEDESEGFDEAAVDLATMLDGSDDEQQGKTSRTGHNDDSTGEGGTDASDQDSSDDEESVLSMSDVEDETNDLSKLSALQTLVSSLQTSDTSLKAPQYHGREAQEAATPSEYGINPRQKLTVADLLPTVTDSSLRKSLKLMSEGPKKSSKKIDGIPGKLEVPLAKRQQDKLDRAAAYQKSKETLNRWIDTVKHNRRAEHLSFPLLDPDALSAKDTKSLLNNTQSQPITSLESTIQSILVESGLAPVGGKSQEDQLQEFEELAMNKIPLEEVQARRAQLRMARELLFREEVRAKRIKKIKSKSYRRVHRKERERNLLREKESLAEAGGELAQNEQDQNDIRRAAERMGARHRESKWAKGVKETGRAAWDEDARSGVAEMARREEELKRRIAGRNVQREEDESVGSLSSSEEEFFSGDDTNAEDRNNQKLKNSLDRLGPGFPNVMGPGSALSSMKFMQNAEAAQKQRNDSDVERLRRELQGEDSPDESDNMETSGRRSYGPATAKAANATKSSTINKSEFEERAASDDEEEIIKRDVVDRTTDQLGPSRDVIIEATKRKQSKNGAGHSLRVAVDHNIRKDEKPGENPWLMINSNKRNNRDRRAEVPKGFLINTDLAPELRITNQEQSSGIASIFTELGQPKVAPAANPKVKRSEVLPTHTDEDADSFTGFSRSSSPEPETPNNQPSNEELFRMMFAGDDVDTAFNAEKTATALSEAPQTVDTSLPGWGSWTGEGISKREVKRIEQQNKRNITTTAGIELAKRKDAKMERVIVNEKRVKKNTKYLASQLPHPYETKAQYERALRVPVGPEWTTKEVFQQATKPRLLVKQGVIAAMERPMV